MVICIVVEKVFLDCLSSWYYHASCTMGSGVIVPVESAQNAATSSCLISIWVLVFSTVQKRIWVEVTQES